MMRYAIIATTIPLAQAEALVRQHGGRDLRVLPCCGQVFATLDPEQAGRLTRVSGLVVTPVQEVRLQQVVAPEFVTTQAQTTLSPLFKAFQQVVSPPLTGQGLTVAILDSGIRKTHQGLKDKLVHEANFSGDSTPEDVYDHGTGVAYLAAGGAPPGDSGMAPGAKLMNIKVMNDQGGGSSETVVAGLEEVMRLRLSQPPDSPLYPNVVNLSLGAPDTGNPMSPVRAAARRCIEVGMVVVAAAGNQGPAPGMVGEPATEPQVLAVGAMTIQPWEIWPPSSRGPTREGLVKPDLVFLGVEVLTASGKADNAYVLKAGTSFSAPALSGLVALGQEYASRALGRRLSLLEGWSILQIISRKPPGAPAGQDNTYGYGMPFADLLRRAVAPAPAAIPIAETMVPLLTLGMFGMLVRGFIREMAAERR